MTREKVDLLFKQICCMAEEEEKEISEKPTEEKQFFSKQNAFLYCDGASKGNPGPAGAGMVLEDASGREIAAWGRKIGTATNNAAEYIAMIEGLRRALEMGFKSIEVRTDSQLMERQLNGKYKVKSASLQPLFEESKSLLGKFEKWTVKHVRRECNKKADKLAGRHAR